jgi:hypothetical protein
MEHRPNSLLFGFQFSGLVTRGVFFGGPMTLLIGIDTWNAGWQVDVSDGRMSESIPSEAYEAIGLVMVHAGGFRTNAPYFAELEQALRAIVQRGSADMADESSIVGLLSMCKTSDSRYDSDGLRPFFNHWRRVHPSPMNLRKIERTFGRSSGTSVMSVRRLPSGPTLRPRGVSTSWIPARRWHRCRKRLDGDMAIARRREEE